MSKQIKQLLCDYCDGIAEFTLHNHTTKRSFNFCVKHLKETANNFRERIW